MQREVIFRERQELPSADLNNIEIFAREDFDTLVADAVGPGLYFTGFDATQTNIWELTVAAGRRYADGKIFRRSSQTVFDLFASRPLSQKKIVALVSWGQTLETDVQPRDFLIDVEAGTTEPQSVAMQRLRSAELQTIAGAEGVQPQKPNIPADNVVIAYVTLGTGGIETIAVQDANRLPQIARNLIEIIELIRWRAEAGTSIDRLKTDLFTIQSALGEFITKRLFGDLQAQVDATRQIADKALALASAPEFQLEFTEYFLNALYSDPASPGYSARIEQGLQFPRVDTAQAGGLQLLNPNDDKVKIVDGLMTPRMTAKTAISTAQGFSGDVALQAYSTVAQTITYAPPPSAANPGIAPSSQAAKAADPGPLIIGTRALHTVDANGRSPAEVLATTPTVTKGGLTYVPSYTYVTPQGTIGINYVSTPAYG